MSAASGPAPASALELIGDTPLLELGRLHGGPGRVLAKAEFLNPGGSIKDRAAAAAVLGARERGQLAPGRPVVEMTSGNMGAGLAVVCAVLGHPLMLTISAGNSPARARMMEGLGAEVVVVPQVDGSPGNVTGADIEAAGERARELAAERGGFFVDQFANPDNVRAHEETTGPEILRQARGEIDAFVASVGSGATFIGVSRCLKAADPNVRCAPVEPAASRFLATGTVSSPRHLLQGSGYGLRPVHWDPGLADEFLAVGDEEADEWRRALAVREGLYVGYTAGANVCAAVGLLRSGQLPPDSTVVTVLPDTGLKYHP